ncbi:MAG: hypothetical protein K2P81_09045 [Bacteriovoracaceae bacterium]|nr:hypothetical protein [Bacteriovoracaceae bacterium]
MEDLDLEFEDEEEQTKKRTEAVTQDVDLEFGGAAEKPAPTPTPTAKPAATAAADSSAPKINPQAKVEATPTPAQAQAQGAQVKKLDDVRAKIAQAKSQAAGQAAAKSTPVVSGANALQLAPEIEGLDLAGLAQMIDETKFEAKVQVAVAQEKSVFMAEMLSDAKLLQHQIQQLLVRVNTKHPDMKPELMAIQKALADFLAKKRK